MMNMMFTLSTRKFRVNVSYSKRLKHAETAICLFKCSISQLLQQNARAGKQCLSRPLAAWPEHGSQNN